MFGIPPGRLSPFSRRSTQEFIAMDLSGDYAKLAHVRTVSNKREIAALSSHAIGGLADVDVARALKGAYNEIKAKNARIILSVPSHIAITKNIEIPSTNPQEIKDIINLQAGRHTPYSREEIIVDYIDIGTYRRSYTKILLVIVARAAIKKQFEMLDKAGLKLERVLFAPEALAHLFPRIMKVDSEGIPVSVAHIDTDFTDFTIILKNKAIFVRAISMGARHLVEEKEKYIARFAEELKKSLEAYQNEDIERSPQALVLTGAIQELKDFEAVLNDALRIPIKVASYFRNVQVSPEAFRSASQAKGASFLNVIAPLLTWDKLTINLIPEEVKVRRALEDRGRDLIKTGILIFTMCVLVISVLTSKIYFSSVYLNKLNVNYQSLNQEAQKLEADFTKVSLVRNYLSKRGYSLEVLTELYEDAPLELELGDIRFDDERGTLSVKGTADSMSAVFAFVDAMSRSKNFKDVKTRHTTKRKEGMKDLADFEVICMLKKEPSR